MRRTQCNEICFEDVDFDEVNRERFPYDRLFESVNKLGKIEYTRYHEEAQIEAAPKPWKTEIRKRAERISTMASQCLKQNKNEMEWRKALENQVMGRFEFEVTCKNCRRRLWRSEIETWTDDPSFDMNQLSNRRKARKACTCGLGTREADLADAGLSLIFDSHADQLFEARDSEKVKPDLVYGLLQTNRLRRILENESKNGPNIGDFVKCSPYRQPVHELLFPFLVLEAKSEKSNDSMSKIEAQTDSAICSFLDLQLKLINAAGSESKRRNGPLVWFLSYRGDLWSVAAVFVDQKTYMKKHFRGFRLWQGKLALRKDALRLLLIVDLIFDWARDVYRLTIIDELLSLARNPTQSLLEDNDIGSIIHDRGEVCLVDDTPELEAETPVFEQTGIQSLWSYLDLEWNYTFQLGAIRDAAFMDHLFYSIEITSESIEDFLKFFSHTKYQGMAKRLHDCLRHTLSWRVSGATLDEVETMWTGHSRESTSFRNPTQTFIARFSVSSFFKPRSNFVGQELGHGWDQVHNLTIIAVAEDTVETLKNRANIRSSRILNPSKCPQVSKELILDFFNKIRQANVYDCLAAAASQTEVATSTKEGTSVENSQNMIRDPAGNPTNRAIILVPDRDSMICQLPQDVYHRLKGGGRLEPHVSFLRASRQAGYRKPPFLTPSHWVRSDNQITKFGFLYLVYRKNGVFTGPKTKQQPGCCIFYIGQDVRESPTSVNFGPLARTNSTLIVETYYRIKQLQKSYGRSSYYKIIVPNLRRYLDIVDEIQKKYTRLKSLGEKHSSTNWKSHFGKAILAENRVNEWTPVDERFIPIMGQLQEYDLNVHLQWIREALQLAQDVQKPVDKSLDAGIGLPADDINLSQDMEDNSNIPTQQQTVVSKDVRRELIVIEDDDDDDDHRNENTLYSTKSCTSSNTLRSSPLPDTPIIGDKRAHEELECGFNSTAGREKLMKFDPNQQTVD